jgi:hypothetical protein
MKVQTRKIQNSGYEVRDTGYPRFPTCQPLL